MNLFATEITIDAPPAVVFRFLTEGALLLEWLAVEADVEAVPGGVLRWRHENGVVMIGRFVDLIAPSRLTFRYGWERSLYGLAPEASLVEIELEDRDGRTLLRLRHSLLPPDGVEAHRQGWEHFLGVLRRRLGAPAHGSAPASTAS